MDGLCEFNIHIHVILIAKEVWKHGIDREPLKVWQTQEVGSNIGLPVRRKQNNGIVLNFSEGCTEALIPPAQLFPATFGNRFVLRGILCVDQMRWVRCDTTSDNLSFAHASPMPPRFNSSSDSLPHFFNAKS